mmetsp:Transcript_4995/g.15227  ORF Transcript_4995/g.15227 Transcript_4995/m.15227 type:complete len:264 (+) Transcript_4995:2201-2992(+)
MLTRKISRLLCASLLCFVWRKFGSHSGIVCHLARRRRSWTSLSKIPCELQQILQDAAGSEAANRVKRRRALTVQGRVLCARRVRGGGPRGVVRQESLTWTTLRESGGPKAPGKITLGGSTSRCTLAFRTALFVFWSTKRAETRHSALKSAPPHTARRRPKHMVGDRSTTATTVCVRHVALTPTSSSASSAPCPLAQSVCRCSCRPTTQPRATGWHECSGVPKREIFGRRITSFLSKRAVASAISSISRLCVCLVMLPKRESSK